MFNEDNITEALHRALPNTASEAEKTLVISRFLDCLDDVFFTGPTIDFTPREKLYRAFIMYGIRYRDWASTYHRAEELAEAVGDLIEDIDLENWALNVVKHNLT